MICLDLRQKRDGHADARVKTSLKKTSACGSGVLSRIWLQHGIQLTPPLLHGCDSRRMMDERLQAPCRRQPKASAGRVIGSSVVTGTRFLSNPETTVGSITRTKYEYEVRTEYSVRTRTSRGITRSGFVPTGDYPPRQSAAARNGTSGNKIYGCSPGATDATSSTLARNSALCAAPKIRGTGSAATE